MKDKIENHWPGIDFYRNVRLVFTNAKTIMRRCINGAGLIKTIFTLNLQFTTELKELKLTTGGICSKEKFQVILSFCNISKWIIQLTETTERTGDFCGDTYVDDELLKFLESKVGKSAMKMLKEKHYGQINNLVHKFFCPIIKIPFSDENEIVFDPRSEQNFEIDSNAIIEMFELSVMFLVGGFSES
ncbi:6020_t:CDS:2, partial [Funneliformis geosporum]